MSDDTKVYDNSTFEARLKELRGDKNLADVAEALGISRVSLGYYESGKRHPDAEVLVKMARYFNVSLDYLVGISDVKSQSANIQHVSNLTGLSESAIKWLMARKKECDPGRVFDPHAVVTTKDGEILFDSHKENKDTRAKRMAIENKMLLLACNKLLENSGAIDLIMRYLFFDRIYSATAGDDTIKSKHGVLNINKSILIGSGDIRNGLLIGLGKYLDKLIDENERKDLNDAIKDLG